MVKEEADIRCKVDLSFLIKGEMEEVIEGDLETPIWNTKGTREMEATVKATIKGTGKSSTKGEINKVLDTINRVQTTTTKAVSLAKTTLVKVMTEGPVLYTMIEGVIIVPVALDKEGQMEEISTITVATSMEETIPSNLSKAIPKAFR